MDRLIVSLHNKISKEDFVTKYRWDGESYDKAISFLGTKGFVKNVNDTFVPTCMIISEKDGEELFKLAEPVSEQIADSLIKRMQELKEKYSSTHLSKTIPFDSISFFVVSDVLLDNWQIGNVEESFLHTERPLRHGKNYYYSFLENSDNETGPFGIYGNMGLNNFSVYGKNQRKVNSSKVNQGLESVPVIDSLDNSLFDKFSGEFTGALLAVLNLNKDYALDVYNKTGYSKEVSFPEFYIWWYHFIYTQTTDIIAKRGLINIPKSGNFFYRSN